MASSRFLDRAIEIPLRFQPSPEGDWFFLPSFPAVETAGYYEPSR